jgi:hypothetical protein
MAEDVRRTSNMRTWKTDPSVTDTPSFQVTHKEVVRDPGLPSETTEHEWVGDIKPPGGGPGYTLVTGADLAEFDAKLNAFRLIIVDARAGLASM